MSRWQNSPTKFGKGTADQQVQLSQIGFWQNNSSNSGIQKNRLSEHSLWRRTHSQEVRPLLMHLTRGASKIASNSPVSTFRLSCSHRPAARSHILPVRRRIYFVAQPGQGERGLTSQKSWESAVHSSSPIASQDDHCIGIVRGAVTRRFANRHDSLRRD